MGKRKSKREMPLGNSRQVKLNDGYFSFCRDPVFTPGKVYKAIRVRPSRPIDDTCIYGKELTPDPNRFSVTLEDDDGCIRMVDTSFFEGNKVGLEPSRVSKKYMRDSIYESRPAAISVERLQESNGRKPYGEVFSGIREKNKIFLWNMAEILNISENMLRQIEGGKERPSLPVMKKMADLNTLKGTDRVAFYLSAGYSLPDIDPEFNHHVFWKMVEDYRGTSGI